MTPPKVFGVEMRKCENPIYWELEGVDMICPAGERWCYWQMQFNGLVIDASSDQTPEQAVPRIESAITRIRAAASRIGK